MLGNRPATANPAGNATIRVHGPQPPAAAVIAKQDPEHTEADYLRDVEKVTQRRGDRSS
jgi:hypothetical protein